MCVALSLIKVKTIKGLNLEYIRIILLFVHATSAASVLERKSGDCGFSLWFVLTS